MSETTLPKVRGFRFAGLPCGIKKKAGARDVGLIVADEPCAAAAVLTKNLVRAAPCEITAERVKGGKLQAVLVNAGCANAATGKAGMKAALEATAAVAKALGLDESLVAPSSTGVIGVVLPAQKIVGNAEKLAAALSEDAALDFSDAILTTDRGRKVSHRTVEAGRRTYTVLGIAKGAGMIHPNMATTLGYVVTDAPVSRGFLKKALRDAVEVTFNRISVDGDTSTNDTIVAMASGAAGGSTLKGEDKASRAFGEALRQVLEDLGKMIVSDGEGAEHLVRIEVSGTRKDAEAVQVARTIATSPLVKTALHGCDPNWGRILGAAGRAGVDFDPSRAEVRIGDVTVFTKGLPCMDGPTEAKANAVMKLPEYRIEVVLGRGKGRGHYFTCDFGHEYVKINADYRS
ncbi:MAG: bifunctional glutamate N-acetyltransferase/amino-acid acetyltransferase ArgJ [Polyangiales bacterium]